MSSIESIWKFQKENKRGGIKITGYLGNDPCPIMPDCINGMDVVSVSNEAFRNNLVLTGMILPNTLRFLGKGAFRGCRNLESIVLPNQIEELPKQLFAGCTNLKYVTLPEKLKKWNSGIFQSVLEDEEMICCKSLERLFISSDNEYFTTIDGVLYNKDASKIIQFPMAKDSIVIPESVLTIGRAVFQNAQNLKSAILHDKIKKIDAYAFNACRSLEQIEIPSSVKSVGMIAFYLCDNLKSITFRGKNTKLEEYAIHYCPNLTIYALEESYAQNYAKENNIPFVVE